MAGAQIPVDTTLKLRADTLQPEVVPGNSFYLYNQKHNPSVKYFYDSSGQVHDYSGNWDFDLDGIKDSLYFIGNGGAHLYFHLRVVLSSDKVINDFPFLEFDMPYLGNKNELSKTNAGAYPILPQFVVGDFDSDAADEIYLNLDLQRSPIPGKWKKKGLTSGYILLDFENKELAIKNFPY